MVGQVCLSAGDAKNTYGTGNFLLLNTGEKLCRSDQRLAQHGVLPVRRRVTGLCTRGLDRGHRLGRAVASRPARDHQRRSGDRDARAPGRRQRAANLYFVPAFSGLFAPYWRSDARGAIVGLSRFHTRAHIARATLEAICYQSRDVVEAMEKDAGVQLDELKVDGGVTANALCMQIQADTLGVEVSKPVVAGDDRARCRVRRRPGDRVLGLPEDLRENWLEDMRWIPQISEDERAAGYDGWKKAVERTLDWVQVP